MTLRSVTFFIVAAISGYLCVRAALIPIGILLGKVPDADTTRIIDTGLRRSLPILAPGALLLIGALLARARRGYGWVPLALLIAAPFASVAALLLLGAA